MVSAAISLRAESVVRWKPLLTPTDRIVFVGDSITGQGGNGGPNGWVGMIGAALKANDPANQQTLVALGGSGQTVGGWVNVEKRSRTGPQFLDVKAFDVQAELNKPADVVVIMLGMNDVLSPSLKGDEADYAKWVENYRTLITALRERTKPRVIALTTPTPCTEDPAAPKNLVMDKMVEHLAKLAAEENCVLLPARDATWEVGAMGRRKQPDFHFTTDQVHPNLFGHLSIAAGMLRGFGESKAAKSILERAVQEADKRADASGLSYEVSLAPDTKPGSTTVSFLIRAYHGDGKIELVTPAGWSVTSSRSSKDGTDFVVTVTADGFTRLNVLKLKSAKGAREISIPAPWWVGTGNIGWAGWTSGVFNVDKGRLPPDEPVRTGVDFVRDAGTLELKAGTPVVWKPFVGGVNYGGAGSPSVVDFAAVTYFSGGEVGYGLRWVKSDKERTVVVKITRPGFAGTSHLQLWVNGETVYAGAPEKARGQDFSVKLKAGWNLVSFKSNFQQWQWQLGIDLLPVDGDSLDALRYSIVPR